jgi:hypothetical protein
VAKIADTSLWTKAVRTVIRSRVFPDLIGLPAVKAQVFAEASGLERPHISSLDPRQSGLEQSLVATASAPQQQSTLETSFTGGEGWRYFARPWMQVQRYTIARKGARWWTRSILPASRVPWFNPRTADLLRSGQMFPVRELGSNENC